MKIIAAFDSWIFLLLIAVAALLRMLASKASDRKDADSEEKPSTPRPDQSSRRPAAGSDEEQIRKFLEALGQPTTSKPPSPVVPRSDVPPRPVAPVRPPAVIPAGGLRRKRSAAQPEKPATAPEEWLRKINLPRPTIERPVPRTVEPPPSETRTIPSPPELPVLEKPAEAYSLATDPAVTAEKAKADLSALISTPSGLRKAMILREIFGPPRSLQPLQDLAGTA